MQPPRYGPDLWALLPRILTFVASANFRRPFLEFPSRPSRRQLGPHPAGPGGAGRADSWAALRSFLDILGFDGALRGEVGQMTGDVFVLVCIRFHMYMYMYIHIQLYIHIHIHVHVFIICLY